MPVLMRPGRNRFVVGAVLGLTVLGVGGLLALLFLGDDPARHVGGDHADHGGGAAAATAQQDRRHQSDAGAQDAAGQRGDADASSVTALDADTSSRRDPADAERNADTGEAAAREAARAASRANVRIPGLSALLSERAAYRDRTSGRSSSTDGSSRTGDSSSGETAEADADDEDAIHGELYGTVVGRERDGRDVPLASFTVEVRTETDTHTATTDAQGIYRIANLEPSPVEVRPAAWGVGPDGERIPQVYYESVTRTGLVEPHSATRIDLTVTRAFDVVGICLDPNQRPISGARVRLFRDASWHHRPVEADHSATTDRDGIFRIAEVEDTVHRLYADAQELPRVVKEGFRPSDYGPRYPLRIVFDDALAVSGRVFDAYDGAPLVSVRVTASHRVEGGRQVEATVLTGPDGYYRVPVAEASMNRVEARRAGYATERHDGILPGRSGLDFHLAPNEQGGVAGRVLDVDGEPAQRFTVGGQEFANALGHFDLELSPGSHSLRFRSEDSGGVLEVDVEVPPGPELLDLGVLMLHDGATVHVRVLDPDDAPLRDATVTLRNTGQRVGPLTGESNVYRFSAISPAEEVLTFEVQHDIYAPLVHEVPAESLPQPPAAVTLRLAHGEYGARILVRTVTDAPLAGAEVAWLIGGDAQGSQTSDVEGVATLTGLAANPARIRVRAEGYASEELDVATARATDGQSSLPETTVTLEPGGSVWGEITARGRTLPHGGAVLPEIRLRVSDGGIRTTTPVQVTLPNDDVRWRFEFPDVPPGEAWLSVPQYQLFETEPFHVAVHETTRRDLDLPGYGTLRVTVRTHQDGPGANLTCYLYTLDTFTVTRFESTSASGVVEYPYLPPGGWAISIVTHGSSDQRLYEIQMPEASATYEHEIQLPHAPYEIRGRLLVEDSATPYSENTSVAPNAEITEFELSVLLDDDETQVTVSASRSAGFATVQAVAEALQNSTGAQQLGLQASVQDETTLVLQAANPAALPYFRVEPNDDGAHALFGSGPFVSSHAATQQCRIALEHIDVPLQTLLAGYISIDGRGEYTLADLVAGHYRPRAVPHYTSAGYAQTFGRDVEVSASNPSPFVTIWTRADGYATVTGTLELNEPGHHPGATVIVYVDGLSDPPTQYPPSASPHRGITQRTGYHFGSFNDRNGTYTIPRLRRGQTYRAWLYVTGLKPVEVEVTVPTTGPAQVTAPPAQTTWDPRFLRD